MCALVSRGPEGKLRTRARAQLMHVGLKATGPRLNVLEAFHQHPNEHFTADEVHGRMRARGDDVGVATVYRVLGQLTDAGILSRHSFDAGRAVYELHRGEHHHHLLCLECGKVDEFVDEVIASRQRVVADERGYALAQCRLALYGYCPTCRARLERGRSRGDGGSS